MDAILSSEKDDDMNLRDIPEKLRTAELCLAAVQENPQALRFVPKSLLEEYEFCESIVRPFLYEDECVLASMLSG